VGHRYNPVVNGRARGNHQTTFFLGPGAAIFPFPEGRPRRTGKKPGRWDKVLRGGGPFDSGRRRGTKKRTGFFSQIPGQGDELTPEYKKKEQPKAGGGLPGGGQKPRGG